MHKNKRTSLKYAFGVYQDSSNYFRYEISAIYFYGNVYGMLNVNINKTNFCSTYIILDLKYQLFFQK